MLTARREERLRALASELSMVRVTILPADLSSREGCRALYRAAQGENIDILVNNAGLGLFGPFDETDLEAELGMLDVNIIAMHMLMKLFLPDLEAKDRGYILNGSVLGSLSAWTAALFLLRLQGLCAPTV